MTGHEEVAAATEQGTRPAEQQSRLSRRSALKGAAGAGLAATALAATSTPALAAIRPARAGHDSADERGADEREAHSGEPIVAHLRNARTGEIDVFHGTSQTRLHDAALAAALIRASR